MSRAVNILHEINDLHDRLGRRGLIIFETGTIRSEKEEYHEGDGWSTLYIAKNAMNFRHSFYSIDINTNVAVKVLRNTGLKPFVHLIEGNSLEVLESLIHDHAIVPDFVYLDSANDANLILNEFKIVEEYAHVVMIDDVDLNNIELKKGKLVIPYAYRRDYKVKLLERQAVIYLK